MISQGANKILRSLVSLLALALALSVPETILASSQAPAVIPLVNGLPSVQLVTEALMGTQGGDASLIGMFLGADAGSPLRFSSVVDPTNFSFSFSLMPGSSYLGQPMTLSSSGTFDPNTGVLSAFSSGTLGTMSFAISDSESWMNTSNGIQGSGDQILSVGGDERGRRRVTHRHDFPDGSSVESGHFVDEHGHRIPGSDFVNVPDEDHPEEPDWDWGTRHGRGGGPYSVFSTGFSPLDGGTGSFTTTISPVPEPSTLLLIGSGFIGIAGVLRKRASPRRGFE